MALDILGQTSAGDMCNAAMKECGALGVGQTALAEDMTDALARLNWMLAEWANKRWMVFHLRELSIVSTGAKSYTLGPGGQINTDQVDTFGLLTLGVAPGQGGVGYALGDLVNLTSYPAPLQIAQAQVMGVAGGVVTTVAVTLPGQWAGNLPSQFPQTTTTGHGAGLVLANPTWETVPSAIVAESSVRPDRLETGNFLRQITLSQPNQIDYPLEILEAREDYNKIALKSLQSFPGYIFYDPAWPLGSVFPYPVPQASIYEIHILIKEQIRTFTNQATPLALPFVYYQAIVSNLALRLRSKYQISSYPGDPLPALAQSSLGNLRGANAAIARLRLPTDMQRSGIYNIFSDQFY